MKNKIIHLAFACILSIGAFAQKSENRTVTSFNKLEVSGAASVKLNKGETVAVKVDAHEEDMAKIITEVKNNRLIVKTKGDIKHSFNVYVTFVTLDQVDVTGASSVKGGDVLSADKLTLSSTGASTLDLNITSKELVSEITGASSVSLNGTVSHHQSEVTGASSLKAQQLSSTSTDIRTTGASSAKVNVSKKIKAVANGASSIHYYGNPADADVSSDMASSVKKSNS
jgi:hypothetical protein